MADRTHRLLLAGGRVLDPDEGEVFSPTWWFADGRVAAVGSGLDGDESVDCAVRRMVRSGADRGLAPGAWPCPP